MVVSVYGITESRGGWINMWDGDTFAWNPIFRRNLRENELVEVLPFFETLNRFKVTRDTGDTWRWEVGGDKGFSVRSFYSSLLGGGVSQFPHKSIWRPGIPPRVRFFAWTAAWERILTLDNLKEKGWPLANRCFMCHNEEETTRHLLMHCALARDIWNMGLALFGILWVLPMSIEHVLQSWVFSGLAGRKKLIWNFFPLAIFWVLWKERNRRVFDDVYMPVWRLKQHFLFFIFEWVKSRESCRELPFEDFLDDFFLGV